MEADRMRVEEDDIQFIINMVLRWFHPEPLNSRDLDELQHPILEAFDDVRRDALQLY